MARKDRVKATNVVSAQVVGAGRASLKREITRSPEFFSTYTNDIQVQTTPWDMRLALGEIGEVSTPRTGEEPVLNVKQIGELRISPQLAKKLTMIMLQQIQAYEERFGQIPVPNE